VQSYICKGMTIAQDGLFDYYDHPNAPIGGFKMSGFGREFGIEGIEEYLETQSVFAR
jgi:acyl-CoA reductase-like NAD-dependent aldehyde dehydrogenase